jgi:uncharacterized protein (DUF736 family)
MSIRRTSASSRSFGAPLRTAGIVVALALLATCATAGAAAPAHRASAVPCTATATGAAWSYKGQKGTVYTVLGVNGASCSLGARWLKRITTSHGTKSPAGWMCLTTSGIGECQVKGGGIFEFTPKLKK